MHIFESALTWMGEFSLAVIESAGEAGVFLLMVIEGVNIPIPSEAILPVAGFAASRGEFDFWVIVLAGAVGGTLGALISYWIGLYGGRPFVRRWGKYFFVHEEDLKKGEHYFKKYGTHVAFWSRLIPTVRTFISLPAGVVRAPLGPYVLFTFLGAGVWSLFLTAVGFWLGERWVVVRPFFERASIVIIALIVLAVVGYVWYHRHKQ